MNKKFGYLIIFAIFMSLVSSGCNIKEDYGGSLKKIEENMDSAAQENAKKEDLEEKKVTQQIFNIVPYDINFTFSDEWEDITEGSPFDLQMKREDRYYCSIFGFKDIDLTDGTTPEDIFEWQKEDLFEKRDFVELVKEEPVWEDDYKKIYRELYSGEFDEGKNYYYCCLIDFKEPAENFAWILFSGIPSWIENDIDEIDQILMAAEDGSDSKYEGSREEFPEAEELSPEDL
ncbi:hypothetical protein D3Z51_14635 [Clostridiaceae bacterium]|nr:hypothetical protein [Clostridiaceae bacterium]RKI11407.1 hypothetical protein D7V81_14085 [bacterium 1XD21-70]